MSRLGSGEQECDRRAFRSRNVINSMAPEASLAQTGVRWPPHHQQASPAPPLVPTSFHLSASLSCLPLAPRSPEKQLTLVVELHSSVFPLLGLQHRGHAVVRLSGHGIMRIFHTMSVLCLSGILVLTAMKTQNYPHRYWDAEKMN